MADSQITVVGNITRDPELRYSNSGTSVARIGIAVNFRRQNRQTNEWDESTSFMTVVCFGDMAEHVSESLSKGARILVTGRLEVREYQTQEGEKRQAVEIIADEIGPSLRWATAKVERVARSGGGGGGGGGRPIPNEPVGADGGGGGGGGGADYDEEPF
jgi:single-strand DNA-binding protein